MAQNENRIQYSDFAVKNTAQSQAQTVHQAIDSTSGIVDSITNLAARLTQAGEEDKVSSLRDATRRLLKARNALQLHRDALEHVQHSYRATGEATDFDAVLGTRKTLLAQAKPYDAAEDLRDFDLTVKPDAEAEDEVLDDDIAIAGGGAMSLGRNNRCPISGKQLLELEHPVADSMNIVYESDAIVHMIQQNKRQGRALKCPEAGTTHFVTEQDLRPAAAVLAAKRRGVKPGAQRTTQRRDEYVLELD